MTDTPSWLPALITLADYGGNWDQYFEVIYKLFCEDFISSCPSYPDKRFSLKRHPVVDGKEATFWHIISEGNVEAERLPDLRRCERIRWPRAIIESMETEDVRIWKNQRTTRQRRNEDRILIALPDFSYLVVLADRGEYVMLWTAFYVERSHQRRKLQSEYETYIESLKGRRRPN